MQTRCLGCMEEYDDSFGVCPECGYEPDTDVDSPIHMQPGVLLHGRYLVGRVLGFGGFGVTYIGWDFTLQHKVAIKEYLPSEFATRLIGQTQVTVFGGKKEEQFGDGMEKFVEEARRLAQFQNEDGIVRIYDSFSENNTAYIVMEYLEGETLSGYLERRGKVPVEEAIQMLVPVLQSLEVVHKVGIVHRDIAPDNIFLTRDGRVKLIDFGASRYATTSHSRSLTVIIKPGYSPEEQYRSRGDQGPHTDVYAISAVLYRMITGIVLPDSMERRACLEKNGKDIVVPLSQNCKVSKNQENAIMNALNVRVEDRTPTVAQFLEELTSEKPVKRIFGRIKLLDPRLPLWAKILIPSVGAVSLAVLLMLLGGVIGPRGNLLTDIMLGQNEVRVPALVNNSVDVADSRLDELGLDCQIVGAEYTDVVPAGTVLHQSIQVGQVVEKDTMVDVYISTDKGGAGIQEGVMPYVVYKTEDEAVSLLESMGLTVQVEYAYDDLIASGVVAAQSLEDGADISGGGSVTLGVSQGEDPNKRIPDSETVALSKHEYELYVGDCVTLQAEGGTGSYGYSSSDEKVATVSRNGELTAVGEGTATITVSSGSAREDTCTVTVQDYTMSLNPGSLTLFTDASAALSVSGIPGNAEISWSSADDTIAAVDDTGKVTGIASGKTTITATWKNGKETYTAGVEVTVEDQGITLSVYKITSFYVGETYSITANTSSTGQQVTWSSSNAKVAKVDSNGVVTAVGSGSATITASIGSHSQSCSVTVIQPSLSLTKSKMSVMVGSTTTLSAKVTPSGTAVSWSSDNTCVAKVSNGKVTAVGTGTATIRAKMSFGGKSYEAVCKVTVTNPSVKLSASSLSLLPGDSRTLTATTVPSGSKVSWKSSNTGVATVSGGTVKAVAVGSATITAQITVNGKAYTASCSVTVAKPSISVTSSASTITYAEREKDRGSCKLTANVKPDNGQVSWSISDSSIASLSANGKTATVTAKSSGKVKITATYTVAGTTLTDSCELTVQKAASTLQVSDVTYPKSGSLENFYFKAKASSNYRLVKVTCEGTSKSNALNISVKDTADPFYFEGDVYSAGERECQQLTRYIVEQYKNLYDLYVKAADLLGADHSVTITLQGKIHDSSGQTVSITLVYVLNE